MEPPDIQFVGPPCGHHGSYTFYRAFKFTKGHKTKVITLGQFFFAKITPDAPVCIGDLQLVWHHKNHDDQPLCSVRLYFLPEDTPDGRLACHGEDEILSESEKVVLTIEDLVSWMCEVQWSRGLQAICEKDVKGPSEDHAQLAKMFAANNCGLCESAKDIDQDTTLPDGDDKTQCAVVVLSFPHYCRYRAVRKRLETCVDVWMRDIVISAVGGFTVSNPDTRILFCRNTVEHPSLSNHASRQNHLAPNLKGRPRKRKLHFKKAGACDSDTNDSEEGYDPEKQEDDTDRKVPRTSLSSSSDHHPSIRNTSHTNKTSHSQKRKCKFALRPSHKEHLEPEEDTFLKNLYQFMQDRNTPISRLPTLGFKELDLYFFYNYTHKLGGYEAITQKRMWKHIYDTLGGHPSNTSAATCTRRHYERLLLPFERHLCGEEDKPLPMPYVKPRKPVAGVTGEGKETGLEESQSTGKTREDKTTAKVTCQNVKVTCQLTLAEKERQWEAMRRKGHPNKDKTAKVTGDNPTKVTCHNVKVAKKLTDKEKEWEVVRRKSGVNKDKVVSMRKTVKMELELLEQATAKPVNTSDDTKTSAENTPSNVALSRVSDPPMCDTEPVSLVMPSVTEASCTVTQKEGAVIAPSPTGMTMQQKSGPCEIAIPKVFFGGSVVPVMSQSPVVYVRTKPGDTSAVAMVTSHDNVRVMPSFDSGKHAVLPTNGSDASPSSRPSVIQQTLTPSVPPGESFRNKSVLNPAPVAVYGPPSRIVPANHIHSTFTNGIHTTHTSAATCSNHVYLPPKLGSDVTPLTRELPSRYVPRPQFIPEPLVMGALQPPGYSPGGGGGGGGGGGDDQPKDLSMKTMRRLQTDRPQHQTLRTQDHAPDTGGVEDGPINLVVTRPRLHSPGAPVSTHWGGVSSGGVVWNARLQTTACDAQRYIDSVTGSSHVLETQRGLQSPQPSSLGTTPCVHPAFPQPPGTSLSNTPVPLFYKGPPQQPPPSRAYGRPPTLLTAVPYGGPVMPDLASAMYSRPRGPFMVPVGIPLVNQTVAHSKGKAKY